MPFMPDISVERWHRLTRKQKLMQYDSHNGTTRHSPDPQERMYGKCGCPPCKLTRKEWGTFPAPINDPRRDGNAMSSINVCDRCPSMATGRALGAVQIRTSADPDSSRIISKDLCPACVEEVILFVEHAPIDTSKRQAAYKKPYKLRDEEDDVDKATIEQLAAALLEKAMAQTNDKRKAIEGKTVEHE